MGFDTLSRNQDFDLLRQRNKQTSSISLKASKLAVFLAGSEFRLRIPFGKRICFPSPSAASKLLCLQSEIQEKILYLFLCPATDGFLQIYELEKILYQHKEMKLPKEYGILAHE